MSEEVRGGRVGVWIAVVVSLVAAASMPGFAPAASQPNPCPLARGESVSGGGPMSVLAPSSSPRPLNPCPGMEWVKTYDGATNEWAKSVQQTADGGYVVLGETNAGGPGDRDLWLLKVNETGVLQWQYLYGGSGRDVGQKVVQTSDGGYVVLAYTYSFGPSGVNAWILKLNALGGVQWQKVYGGAYSFDIQQTSDGGYVTAGVVNGDAWVVRLDSSGNVAWQKAYGGKMVSECASSIQQTYDGGFAVAGVTVYQGFASAWLFRLNGAGSLQWQKLYGFGTGGQLCGEVSWYSPDVVITPEGGFLLASSIFDDWSQDRDGWAAKLDVAGNVQWQKRYGTSLDEYVFSVDVTSDGGYVFAGNTGDRAWVIRLDSQGTMVWQKSYGTVDGPARSFGNSLIHQTSDGGFVLAGHWSEGIPTQGVFVMKLNLNGYIGACTDPGMGADSSAVASDSARTASKTKATSRGPSTSASSTAVAPSLADGVVSQQCFS